VQIVVFDVAADLAPLFSLFLGVFLVEPVLEVLDGFGDRVEEEFGGAERFEDHEDGASLLGLKYVCFVHADAQNRIVPDGPSHKRNVHGCREVFVNFKNFFL